jgi:glycosyltransferase involved in cell wall biosynthesis
MNEELRTKNNEHAPPLVSVVIGTYNREKYIRETLDSVFAQTYPNIEVIVVDDASTDGTVNIVREYGERVQLVVRDTNSGMCPVTRNQGARMARGGYVAFLDSDDTWYPKKIAKQVALLESREDVVLCHTYCHIIDGDSKVIGIRHEGNMPADEDMFRSLISHCWITISSTMVRRTLFNDVGWFDEDPRCGIWGEDIDFFLRVSRHYKTSFIPEILTCYRKSQANTSMGSWQRTPLSLGYHHILIRERKSLWRDAVSRDYITGRYADMCRINSVYWRDHGFPARSIYFCLRGMRMQMICADLCIEIVKSLGSALFRRGEMRRRRSKRSAQWNHF